jgi:hypothetical protein
MGSDSAPLKSERFAMAYRLLLAYAFVLPGSSKILTQGFGTSDPQRSAFEITIKLLPRHDRVVIQRNDAESKTFFDTAQEKPQQGKVIAIGPGGPRRDRMLHGIDTLAHAVRVTLGPAWTSETLDRLPRVRTTKAGARLGLLACQPVRLRISLGLPTACAERTGF